MALHKAVDLAYKVHKFDEHGGVPASGYILLPATAVIGDTAHIIRLSKGIIVDDCIVYSGAGPASSTLKAGLVDVDGTARDDDFFFAATSIASAAVLLRKTNPTPPLLLEKDAFVVLALAGANLAATLAITMLVKYRVVGHG